MPRQRRSRTRRIAMFAYDQANTVDVTGPLEVFSGANMLLAREHPGCGPAYAIEVIGLEPGLIRTTSGIGIHCERRYDEPIHLDTLLVAGGDPRALFEDRALLSWLRARPRQVRRIGSVCTGAFLLAAAGLLDRRRATTHWEWTDELSRFCPRALVEPDAIYVRDGKICTSAGVTAGMDLALSLVEEDHGRSLALAVARQLVIFLKRPGGQSQFSAELAAQSIPEGSLRGLPEWIVDHTGEDMSVERLAARVAMSPRNFARVFLKETGCTPAKFIERVRVERARRALEDTGLPLDAIAADCGFGSAERMRRSFKRHLRVLPRSYRERFEGSPSKGGDHEDGNPAVRRDDLSRRDGTLRGSRGAARQRGVVRRRATR